MNAVAEVFRSYKRYASNLRDGAEMLARTGTLQLTMSWKEGESFGYSFDENAALVRYAALLRPFMASNSSIEVAAVWGILLQMGLVDAEACKRYDRACSTADNLGIAFLLNGKQLTARELYFAYAEGLFFNEDADARRLLDQLSTGCMEKVAAFLFHCACVSYASLVFFVLEEILSIQKKHPRFQIARNGSHQCIYCLTQDGDFGPEEHVIPECFGSDELVIRGGVCKTCNNMLSNLDQYLAESEILSLLRVMYVDLTKKGKFPSAEFRDFTVKKVKPRQLLFTSRTNKQVFSVPTLKDGMQHFSIKATGRKPLDPHYLGRALFKIGLGVVAHDAGVPYACDPKYDTARDFIAGRTPMPNHLIISKNFAPTPTIRTSWRGEDNGTVVILGFYGACFAFNLQPAPFRIPPGMPPDLFQELWLG